MIIYDRLESGILIVEYEDSFAASVADMINKSTENWGGNTALKTESQVVSERSASSDINAFLALDGETVVGFCSLRKYFADANTLYIPYLNVRPDYMGKKIGKALVLQAVNRTIELGFPRLDLHTWPGNTEAVPLYKKCGFLWEDRPDTNHLVNFIPQILNTELFADFFARADWYADSTREIKTVRDGVKVNGFEVFGYSWEHAGETLQIGYERTGRQVRLIETNDYKIEFMAQGHELAFGLSYDCQFDVTNKSGKELRLKINGVNDKNIMFDFSVDKTVNENEIFSGNFFVGEIKEQLSKWRVHPCLQANVEINGKSVNFGLGIMAKFPISLEVVDEQKVKHAGMDIPCFFNIKSALPVEASIHFNVGENDNVAFNKAKFIAEVPAKGKTSIETVLSIKKLGYTAIPVQYSITLNDGRKFSFEKPLHYYSTNLLQSFYAENDDYHTILNGPWQFKLYKRGNEAEISHLTNSGFKTGNFDPPKFGKPYDDEFGLIKPIVKSYKADSEINLEAEYTSEKFEDMVITQIFSLSAAGVISRKNLVENRGTKTHEIMVNDEYGMPIEKFTVFKLDGKITMNHSRNKPDGLCDGLDAIDSDDFDENWIFEGNPSNPIGICWSLESKPTPHFGNWVMFEIDCGRLLPGESFTSGDVQFVYGLFDNFKDFRNYALRANEKGVLISEPRVEVRINGYNPVLWPCESVKIDIINNRETELDGDVTVTLGDISVKAVKNPDGNPAECSRDEDVDCFAELKMTSRGVGIDSPSMSIDVVLTQMNFLTYEKTCANVLFFPKGEVGKSTDGTKLVVSNGVVEFSVDPAYAHVCNSLITTHDGVEWFNSKYPKLEPYAWFNPFLGGIRIIPEKLNINAILKEDISAEFAELKDSFGNIWQGIKTTLAVQEDEENRGVVYESFFLTLPGLPLLCAFFRIKNNTGIYWSEEPELDAFLSFGDETVFGEFVDKNGQEYRLKFGEEYQHSDFKNTIKFSSGRQNYMYVFVGSKICNEESHVDGDAKHPPIIEMVTDVKAAPGKTFTTRPMFLIISDKDFPNDSLDELERIRFDENN